MKPQFSPTMRGSNIARSSSNVFPIPDNYCPHTVTINVESCYYLSVVVNHCVWVPRDNVVVFLPERGCVSLRVGDARHCSRVTT